MPDQIEEGSSAMFDFHRPATSPIHTTCTFLEDDIPGPRDDEPNETIRIESPVNSNRISSNESTATAAIDFIDVSSNANAFDQSYIDVDVMENEQARPRQLGRRAEFRSRIVSITTELSAEGDQVSRR